jgi:glycosyltransferase involved in cell wall biosynthesis
MTRLSCEWVAFLDDDDLLDPTHIERLLDAALEAEADLAFSWHRREGSTPAVERVPEWSDYAYGVMLGGRNLIPVTVLARREAVLAAGGFWPEDRYEDHALWLRMLARGSQFTVVPEETWTYRMLGGNRTWLPA